MSLVIGSKKKYDSIKVAAEATALKAELKNQEALMINNPDIINDESFKEKHDSLLLKINDYKQKFNGNRRHRL